MTDTNPKRIDPNKPDADKVAAYGAFSFLYMRSSLHRDLTVSATRMVLEPPISIGSYKVFYDANDVPRAACTWASLSDDAQEKVLCHETLAPEDWASGSHMWVMEIVAPFGQGSGAQVMHWLRHSIAKNVDRVMFMRADPITRSARFVECKRQTNGRLGARILKPADVKAK